MESFQEESITVMLKGSACLYSLNLDKDVREGTLITSHVEFMLP